MKLPLVRVPDFRLEVERDARETKFYQELGAAQREEYLRDQVQHRALLWACQTAAAAYNIAVIIAALLVLTNGVQIVKTVQTLLLK